MRWEIRSFVRRLHKDESGAVMVLVAISIAALLGVTALAIDVANLVYAQRRLQATTDMAAQAAALDLNCNGCTAATPVTTANTYSAVSGALNAQPNLNVTMVSGYPQVALPAKHRNLPSPKHTYVHPRHDYRQCNQRL